MKSIKIMMLLALPLFSVLAFADVNVRGYTKGDGTYVPEHHRSSPNDTQNDNWSTKGNVNPYNGREGTKNPDNNSWQNR